MFQNFKSIQNQLNEIASKQLLAVFTTKINTHQAFIVNFLEVLKSIDSVDFNSQNETHILVALMKYKEQTGDILNEYTNAYCKASLSPVFELYFTAIDSYVNTLESSLTVVQDKNRFEVVSEDSKIIKFKKFIKRCGFKVATLPKRVANGFKKIQKKDTQPIAYWNQKIALQNITTYYYAIQLIKSIEELENRINIKMAQTIKMCWDLDASLDVQLIDYVENRTPFRLPNTANISETLTISLEALKEDVASRLKEIQVAIAADYKKALTKSGTLELNNTNFSENKLTKLKVYTEKNRLNLVEKWNNTFLVLTDDWGVDLEIYKLIFKTNQSYVKLENQIKENSQLIVAQLDLLKEYQIGIFERINNTTNDEDLAEAIQIELKALRLKFNARLLPAVIQKITALELTSGINSFKNTLNNLLQKVSKSRALSKDFDISTPTPSSEFSFFSPYELINYESWPVFSKKIDEAKVQMTFKFNDTIQTLNELSNIVQFNLESALVLIEENQDINNDPKKVAIEGLQRNLDKLDNMYPKIEGFKEDIQEMLQGSIIKFKESIVGFTESENILQLKLVIAKAKSIEKSKEFKNKIKRYIIYAIPLIIGAIKKYYFHAVDFIKGRMLAYGLLASSKNVNEELSDFLVEAEKSVNKLPFIYQRLFRSETLTNENFYSGNTAVLETISSAYNLWENDRYRTIIIIGEKGSGKTSFLNYFLKKKKVVSKTVTLNIKYTTYTNEQLLAFLSEGFSKEFISANEVINFLNTSKKKLVIIEDLQHLYLRKPNGFEAFHTLMEIIAKTETNIFWVTTCTKYAYNYLNKTIVLSEQFTTVIDLDHSNIEILKEAISVRHNASGYGLYFEEPSKEFLNKKYQKESDILVKQQLLEQEFYADLFNISKSNFKIAFMFWLRSACSVQGSKIHLRSLKEIDLSFVENVSTAKLFVLNIILHHEQLTVDHIAEILGFNSNEVKRLTNSLFEDGLLLKYEAYFAINTLLYRRVIALLISKNFIH